MFISEKTVRDIEERLARLERLVWLIAGVLEGLGYRCHAPHSAPSAGTLVGNFTQGDPSMSTTQLTATIPTTRQDGTALLPTDIGSITYQKTSLTGSPPVVGPNVTLQVNSAVNGAGLLPTDLSFTDVTPLPGDSYTVFFTDTLGHIGAPSNAFVNPAQLSPPSAGTLTGTFTP